MNEYTECPIAGAAMSLLVRVGRHLWGRGGGTPGAASVSGPGKEVVFQDAQASGCVPAVGRAPPKPPGRPGEQ